MDRKDVRARIAALPTWAGVVATVLCFLFAVRLLGTATGALTPTLQRFVAANHVSALPALGTGWLVATLLGNETVVAAVSLSLHASGLLTASQLLLLVVGSRLGATGIVLVVGALDALRGRAVAAGTTVGVGSSLELGLLASGLTAVVYLPTAVGGYLLLRWLRVDSLDGVTAALGRGVAGHGVTVPTVFEPVAASVIEWVGAPLAAAGAVVLLFVSLDVADRVLDSVDGDRVRAWVTTGLDNRWRAGAVGFVVTALTTSVAFSLGIVVPLYSRGYLDRRETAPYVLGANVGTLADTLVVAMLLGDGGGVVAVVAVGVVASAITLVVLLALDPVVRAVSVGLDTVRRSPWHTVAALAGFLAVPAGFVVFG
ncbi:sodium:phosphate symporter [Salinigranum rubrum]|uniref:Sodium:phosphate symporter n=1 Tax=Salinigranum rubrum TaxID=755307 RepID=A0A2I8VID5_9EURY|nr:sodium:phosphate symporter [Salinigranum rubrum]AUV81697.1 sodium:phosphate symporter [Salinigranum rubrum]